jgi:signal transduction histidine kinase
VNGWAVAFIFAAAVAIVAIAVLIRTRIGAGRPGSGRAQDVADGRAQIATMLSHELRGPVATIKGLVATARAHYERLGDEERLEFLELIDRESRRLLATTDQASLAMKLDAGSLAFDIRPQDLAVVVREGVDAARSTDREVTIEAAEGITLQLDRRWIGEVVRQLVDNGVKFSPPGSPIALVARRDGAEAVVEVRDAGPGIPQPERERVFERFARWRPEGYETTDGAGLGLFICRSIVDRHRGEIEIEGLDPGGTMLRIRLPMEAT